MMKYRFKSENHKQEFVKYKDSDDGSEDVVTYNQSIVDFLDSEGLSEFYVTGDDMNGEFFIIVDGDIAKIPHQGSNLAFHLFEYDIDNFLSVV